MFEGTVFFLWSASSTGWPKYHTLWNSWDVEDGNITLWIGPDQRITAVFRPNNAQPYHATSCPVDLEIGADLSVAVGWKGDAGDIVLEGQIAGTNRPNVPTADRIVASPRYFFWAGEAFAEANEKCRLKRDEDVSQIRPRGNRRLLSLSEELDQLRDATTQLSDLLAAIGAGRTYFDTALSARIRALICRFKSAQSYPLLQRVAGRRSLPLIVYAFPFDGIKHDHPMVKELVVFVIGPVEEKQIKPEYAAMDIDVWLDLRHVSIKGSDYTNNDVLRAVADTTGSHYDASIGPLVEALRSIRLSPEYVTMINTMLVNAGKVALALNERVLKELVD